MTEALTWHQLHFPSKLTEDNVLGMVRTLATRPRRCLLQQAKPVVFEVISTAGTVRWQLGLSPTEAPAIIGQLRTRLPGVRLESQDSRHLPAVTSGVELRLNTTRRVLRSDLAEGTTASLLSALSGVHRAEALVLHWLVGPWLPRPVVKRTGVMRSGIGFERLILTMPLDAEDAALLKAKLAEPLLGVIGRIAVSASTPGRRQQLVQRVLGALQLARQPGVGLVTRWTSPRASARRLVRCQRPLIAWPCPLNAAELTGLLGWPIGNPSLPGVAYRGGRQLPPPRSAVLPDRAANSSTDRIVGRATFPGAEGLLRLRPRDALQHLHVIGPTGAGKSTLLGRLIHADLAAGRGVVVIEPKADLIADVLDRMPANRVDDVVLLDPTDREYAVGLNVLAAKSGHEELAVDQLVHLFHSLYRDSWGPRTADILQAGLLTLARVGSLTLCELPLLLTDKGFRHRLLAALDDPLALGPFWSWFESISEAERASAIAPAMNKLRAFTSRRAIRSILGQADARFRLSQVFSERRVLLVNLAKGVVGPEAARLLGSLVFSALWETALGRSAVAPDRRQPVMVFIDEFQDYVHGLPLDLGEVLAQARGLGIGLTLAHQHLGQLDAGLRAGVLTNARSRIVFQTGSADGPALATSLGGGLNADDLRSLGQYEAYASLIVSGQPTAPASMVALAPTPGLGTAAQVRARSRSQWARSISEVDAELLARRQAVAPAAATGGRRPRRQP